MAKVFYNLPNDITDRSIHIGLMDILQKQKCVIYTEVNQLKGEKIDVAYIMYNETLITQIADLPIKKMSIFSKGDDKIIIPRNYVKYSSDVVQSMSNMYNIIINNRMYKTETEIIIVGVDNIHQDVVRNIYTLYGNVITSTLSKYDKAQLDVSITSRNLPNSGGMYYVVYTALEGLKQCSIKKNIIKVRSDEHFSDLRPVIGPLTNCDKIILSNVSVKKVSAMKYSIGDHIIAGKYDQLLSMYTGAIGILNDKIRYIRKKLRLDYTFEQILAIGYLKDSLDYIRGCDEKYVKEIMIKNFAIVPIDDLGYYAIPCGETIFTNIPNVNADLYQKNCFVKSINDI